MYCGDEVGAIVCDIGSHLSRFGSSGWDSPKNIFSTSIAVNQKTNNTYVVDGSKLRVVQEDLEILQPITSESIDWNSVETILRYGMENVQLGTASSTDFPLLLAENYFNTSERKEKLFELLFETIGVPASYLCHNGALSSFCYGRPTSLIIDFGASQTRIVPIVDGFALNRTTLVTSRGGDSIDQLLLTALQGTDPSFSSSGSSSNSRKRPRVEDPQGAGNGTELPSVVKPWFLSSPRYTSLSLSSSFTRYHTLHLIRDMKQWMSFIPSSSHSLSSTSDLTDAVTETISQIPPYELPDKTLVYPSSPLCLAANQTFFPSASGSTTRQKIDLNPPSSLASTPHSHLSDDLSSLPLMIWNVILRSDVDIRKELLGNVIPVGGGSVIDGLAQRLSNELSSLAPSSIKVKVVNNAVSVEKQHAAWIGGSVLSICGSFQQLWISRQEYDEHGPKVYLRKSQH